MITANPDIVEHKLTEEDEFFVLACDGTWHSLIISALSKV